MLNFMDDCKNLGWLFAVIVFIVDIFVILACSVIYGVFRTIGLIIDAYRTINCEFYRLYWAVKTKVGF